MSTALARLQPPAPRKRTSSFSFPSTTSPSSRPLKAPRTSTSPMGALRRTASYLSPPTTQMDSYTSPIPSTSADPASLVPYHRTLRYYKDQRERRKSILLSRHTEPATITIITKSVQPTSDLPIRVRLPHAPSASPPAAAPTAPTAPAPAPPVPPPAIQRFPHTRRPTSPLAPVRTPLPPRTAFPRSKPEPDLYRKAITARMRCSPEGQKILVMGARLAVSILTATRELERIVAQQNFDLDKDRDREDVIMDGPIGPTAPLTNSWVFVPGEDWEMVDCSA